MTALLAALSSAIWGTSDFLGGLAARRLPAVAVVGSAQSAGLLTLLTVTVVTGGFGGPTGWIGWALMAGLAGAAGLVVFYTALALGTMGVVSPIAALGAIVPVVGGLLNGESPSALQFAGMGMGLAGAVLASGPELRGSSAGSGSGSGSGGGPGSGSGARSVGLAALAGLLFGVALLGIQRGAQTDPLLTILGMRIAGVSVFAVTAIALRSTGGVRRSDLPRLALIGVGDVGANLLFAVASTRGLTSIVAVLGALYPVATVLLGAIFLSERMLAVQRAGITLALGGVVLLALA
jgi:drug/metabolite transporter (DMT)-like permease